MKSRRRSPDNPVEFVELRVSIRADRATSDRIRELFPSAKVRSGTCELTVDGEKPADVAVKAGEMLDKLRRVLAPPKGFKNPEGAPTQD